MAELIIDESNFSEYFFDVRQNKMQKGQVMACYTAKAEFVKSPEKRQVIDLLQKTEKAQAISQLMRRVLHASEKDSYSVPKRIAEDLMSGMGVNKILDKPYEYVIELFYYAMPEHIPSNDPHWSSVSLIDVGGLSKDSEDVDTDLVIQAKIVD